MPIIDNDLYYQRMRYYFLLVECPDLLETLICQEKLDQHLQMVATRAQAVLKHYELRAKLFPGTEAIYVKLAQESIVLEIILQKRIL